jgi:uncharacterized protein YceH (UPF0502 family)
MGKFNNYGGYVGKQNGDAGSFNNVGCTIGEQVIDNRKKPKKESEDFDARMRAMEERMAELKARMEVMKKRGGL